MAASDFLSYFSMKNMPFTTSIGTDFLYKNPLQNDVKQKLGLTVDSNSFALLTGRRYREKYGIKIVYQFVES